MINYICTSLKLLIAFAILISVATSCNEQHSLSIERFIHQNNLKEYKSIYIVSCISCTGDMQQYIMDSIDVSTSIVVVDKECKESLPEVGKLQVMYVDQNTLDKYFGEFGNMIILKAIDQHYIQSTYPSFDSM